MEETKRALLVPARLVSVRAGLVLLALKRPSDSSSVSTVFVCLVAIPFLVLPLVPGRRTSIFSNSFLVGFGCLLALGLWLYSIFVLVFSFEKSLSALCGILATAVTVAVIAGIVGLKKLPAADHNGPIALGIILGLLYFPVTWIIASRHLITRVVSSKEAQVLYGPSACALRYQVAHAEWPSSLRQTAALPGCQGIGRGVDYQRQPTGFLLRSKELNPGYYTNESGIVTYYRPSGPTMSTCGDIVGIILFRLKEERQKNGRYPASLDEIPNLVFFLRARGRPCLITYDRESPERFRLNSRPKQYGVTSVRIYYADETGVIHATPFDRSATLQDPVAPEKEVHGS